MAASPQSDFRAFSLSKKIFMCTFTVKIHTYFHARKTTVSKKKNDFWIFHANGIKHYIVFYLFFSTQVNVCVVHSSCSISQYSFFSQVIFYFMAALLLFMCRPVNGHLNYFHYWAVMYKADVDIQNMHACTHSFSFL